MDNSRSDSKSLQRLRLVVEQANYLINTTTYQEARSLFTVCTSTPQEWRDLQQLAPEYDLAEFLLCVDSTGSPVYPTADIITDFRETVGKYPDFERWFQEAVIGKDKQPVLLVARWLCHLVGFRHRSVHLFIDHPSQDGYTLVQVRSVQKSESPGRFDLPAAGHIVGLETTTNTLFKELEEEVNLNRNDINAPEMVGSYDYHGPSRDSVFHNVEFRIVFQTRLKPNGLSKIRFVDGEVAAISVFALSELQALIGAFPERVASGLTRSFPIYLKNQNG